MVTLWSNISFWGCVNLDWMTSWEEPNRNSSGVAKKRAIQPQHVRFIWNNGNSSSVWGTLPPLCHLNQRCWLSGALDSELLLVCSVGQSYMTLCHTMNCSSPGFSVYGICQARILEWITIFFSWRSSSPKDRTHISCIERRILYNWVNWEALDSQLLLLLSHLVKSNSL